MKIRSNFVSNSSTCSFIVIGYKIDIPKGENITLWLIDKLFSDGQKDFMALKYFKKPWRELDEDEQADCLYEYRNDNSNNHWMMLSQDDGLDDEHQPVIGTRLAESDSYEDFDCSEISFGHMLSELWKIKEALNLDENLEPSLFIGQRMC